MMPLLRSVLGGEDDTHWGQALILPHAYGVVEVEDPHGQAMKQGVTLLSRLTQALGSAPTSIEALAALVDAQSDPVVKTIIVMLVTDTQVWIVLRGAGGVYVKREGKLACLLAHPGSIAGSVRADDVLWLGSAGACVAFPAAEIGALVDEATAEDIAERMSIAWHERGSGIGGAALVLRMQPDDSSVDEESVTVTSIPEQQLAREDPSKKSLHRHVDWRHSLKVLRSPQWLGRVLTFISSTNRKMAVVTLLFFLFFAVSVGFGLYRQATNTKARAVAVATTEAQRLYDEGEALMELNPVKGRERLSQAKAVLDPARGSVSAGSPQGREFSVLYTQITTALTSASRVVHTTPSVFFDVGLIKKGSTATAFGLDKDTLGIVDSRTSTVFAVTLSSKNGKVLAGGGQFTGASLVTVFGDRVYVLVDGGVHAVDMIAQKVTPWVVKKTDDWGTISGLVSYGGNLYLLDTQKSRIWKYVATEKGFSDIREYLNPDTLPNLSQAMGIAIDGSVWLGGQGLVRFTQGKDNTFVPKGIDPALGTTLLVYTSDDTKYIYILDRDHKRVVQLEKDGLYSAQYVWEGAFTPTAFSVSEAQKKILFLSGGTIYSIDLD